MALTDNQQSKLELLEASLGATQGQSKGFSELDTNPALCASLKREERLQYNFMYLYQAIVLILAVVVLALLLFAAWRTVAGQGIQGVIAGAGALVSGTAAVFLRNQRQDARDAHEAAQAGLEKYKCS